MIHLTIKYTVITKTWDGSINKVQRFVSPSLLLWGDGNPSITKVGVCVVDGSESTQQTESGDT